MRRLTRHGIANTIVTFICAVFTVLLVADNYFTVDSSPEQVQIEQPPPEQETEESDSPVEIVLPEETHNQIIELLGALQKFFSSVSPMLVPIIVYFTQKRLNYKLLEETKDNIENPE